MSSLCPRPTRLFFFQPPPLSSPFHLSIPASQVNGGSIQEKVAFAQSLFEQPVSIDEVFQPNEMIDTIAITKGRGTQGVVTRWGVTRLPRKTHRGLRKVWQS